MKQGDLWWMEIERMEGKEMNGWGRGFDVSTCVGRVEERSHWGRGWEVLNHMRMSEGWIMETDNAWTGCW